MALIDVSELLTDPDFTNTVTLIRRASTVNTYGENVMTETQSTITAVVQGANTESLERVPEGARLSDLIDVYYKGQLTAESPSGYADIIVWGGKRYQVFEVVEDFMNFGAGFTKAVCKLEAVNA
ncbi:hypothetical protein [Klebsiella pneumoniae]